MSSGKCGQACVQQSNIDSTLAVFMNGICQEMPLPMSTPFEREYSGLTSMEMSEKVGMTCVINDDVYM